MTKTRSSNSSTSDADEDRVTAPIFTPTLPPRLTSTSHAALVKWRRERREYEETIRSRAKDSAADLIVPVKSTFDEGLLRMWCLLRWKLSIDDVTDSHILAEVDKIIDSVKNNDVPDIDVEMREQLRMDLSESDVSERVIQYFKKCYEIVDDHGWRVFFTGLDGRKQLCRILIASLEPQALRDEVERAVRFQSRKAKEDEVALHDLILTKALDQEKAFQILKRSKRDRGERETGRPSARGAGKPPNKKQRVVETSKGGPRPPLKSETDRPKVPPTPCPHCNDMHWLSECPTATDDQKAEIRRKLRAQRADDSKRKVARTKRLRECLPSEEKSVTLNDKLTVPYCADSGADRSVISRHYVEQLQQLDPSVKVESLDTPFVSETVGDHEVVCTASIHTRLLLNTAAGPVALHEPVECLIVEEEEPEFILGQDVLLSLGIDVDRQLEQLANRVNDVDDGDTELKDDLPDLAHPGTDEELSEALDRLVTMALANGFPHKLEEKLRDIVLKHDIWRLELGKDPPANVEPLKIRLKDGASAVKSKPRRYPPAVREFRREFNAKLVELGWIYENPNSRWASPVLPVRKPDVSTDEYRQTCD